MAVLRFSVFDLDPATGELWRRGRRLSLAAQPFKVLCLLVGRPREVVTREELRRHVWGDQHFVEFDQGLNFCIASIRSVLGDDARTPRFIETLPRRGYRFLAEVRSLDGEVEGAVAAPIAPVSPRATRGFAAARRWSWLAALPVLVAQAPREPNLHTRVTAVPEALAAFDHAREVSQGPAGLRRSVYWYREATRRDPRFAEAHYALGDVYLRLAERRDLPAESALTEARDAAVRAVELEPIAATRQLLGTLRLLHDRDWEGARVDLAEAVRLEPKWDSGLVSYARFLSASGDDAAALATIDRAEVLSPSCDLVLFDSGILHYRARRYEDALTKLTRAAEFGPPHDRSVTDWRKEIQSLRILVRLGQQDWAGARQEALEVLVLNGVEESIRRRFADRDPRDALAAYYKKSLEIMTEGRKTGHVPATRIAGTYAALGASDDALTWLERAEDERDPELLYALRNPEYDSLRAEPRFRALEERVHPSRPRTLEASRPTRFLPWL